jgi:hypothetical protein
MSIANIADKVLLWIHGRRLGLLGDGQKGTNSAIVVDDTVVATTRGPIVKVATSLSAAGAVTIAGAVVGDDVVSVLDMNAAPFVDVTSSFEAAISVAGQIQQTASTSGHGILVQLRPAS